ncbi:MAG: OmpA family protein [Vicingaceae bacterium]
MRILRTCITLLFMVLASMAFAQKDYLSEAGNVFAQERYYEAIDIYKKAYTQTKEKEEKAFVIFRIAECYRLADNPKQAEVWYSKAVKANYSDPIAQYYLAESKKFNGKFEDAAEEYKRYLEKNPNDKKGKDGLKSVEMTQEWIKNPTRFEVENAPIINSEYDDFSPLFIDKKNDVMVFTSSREGSTGNIIHERTGQSMPDLYETTRDRKGKWSEPKPISETVNTIESEGSACVNERRNTLYFTRCPYGKDGVFGCQLYWSKKAGQNWGEAELIPITADTNTVGQPAMSNDDKILVFASDMPGGYGGKDLWYIVNKGKGIWSEPINLGASINTEGHELFPSINFAGHLYFSSTGHIGMGGLDIFKAELVGENKWGNPENLQYPINSSANDFGIVYDGQKNRGYLSSDREGGVGETDIWEFFMPPLVFALEGIVTNKETGDPIANATIDLKGTDGATAQVITDDKGEFQFADKGSGRYINENTSYTLMVAAAEYLNAKGNETTVGEEESKVFYHEYRLVPVDKPIKLPEILFELAKWDLLPQSKDSLSFLFDILIDNPTIVIELAAHTDSRDSDQRNLVLSQKRAQSCVDYLIERGIDRDRMIAKGYGESRPKITDSQIAKLKSTEEKEAAHQQNRRVEFSVLRDDFIPK